MNTTTETQQRSLKIEAVGDFAVGDIKPLIRLRGRWLEQAGFKPGHRVEIQLLSPGTLSLQFKAETPALESNPTESLK